MSKIKILNGAVSSSTEFNLDIDNSTVLTVSSSGIGIGTTNPAPGYTLDVYNNVADSTPLVIRSVRDYTADYGPKLLFALVPGTELGYVKGAFRDSSNGNYGVLSFGVRTSDALGVQEKMRIESNGYIGMGITSPSYPLHLLGGARFDADSITDPDATTTSNYPADYYFTSLDATSGIMTLAHGLGTNTGNLLTIADEGGARSTFNYLQMVADTNGTPIPHVTFRGDGRVGIGTTDPVVGASSLSSEGDALTAMMHIYSNTNNTHPTLHISAQDTDEASILLTENSSDYGYGARLYYEGAGSNFFNIEMGDAEVWTHALTIDRYGYVGIGTTAPGTLLHLEAASNPTLKIQDTGGKYINIHADSSYGYVDYGASSDLLFRSATAERMRITAAGNVGIGLTNPQALLSVGANTHLDSYSVSVTSAAPVEVTSGGASLATDGVYLVSLITTGTGTDTGGSYLVWYNEDSGD